MSYGSIYDDGRYKKFPDFLREVYNSYDNLNIFLHRKKKYVSSGRNQTEDQARNLDVLVLSLLEKEKVPFIKIDADAHAPREIFNLLNK